jgi:hypothetical protein
VIYEFGEERRSRRIARAICRSRPIRSTAHLAEVISAAARPMNSGRKKDSSRDANFSSSSNLRKPRTGRSAGAAGSGAPDSEARGTRGGDQFSLAGRSHRKGCLPREQRRLLVDKYYRNPLTQETGEFKAGICRKSKREADRNPRLARSAPKGLAESEAGSRFRVRFRKTCRSPRHSCNGVPGLSGLQRTKIRWGGTGSGLQASALQKEKSRRKLKPEAGLRGSVVGIQI